ncbi:HAD family hydrolase [Clostridiaceae bacterium 35-E11]
MINTILFDLDGTLLPMELHEFTKHYFDALSSKCAHMIEPKLLQKAIWASTEMMVKNLDENKTNMEVFMEDFCGRIDVNIEALMTSIDEFYRNDFKHLKFATKPIKIAEDIVKILKDKGYTLVIATNPLFPREAILHRIQWSGLNIEDFTFITDYESSHFCKPNLEFFKEVLFRVGKSPQECLMVGNDVQEDLVAAQLGIKTFLIEDYMINRENKEVNPDFKGSYNDLLTFVKNLPPIKKES